MPKNRMLTSRPARGLFTVTAIPVFLLLLILLALLPFPAPVYAEGGIVYTNPDTGFAIYLDDGEDLLSADEEALLIQDMMPITEYGNAGFVSGRASGTTSSWAEQIYRRQFGTDSGSVFFFDMENRVIQIMSGGSVYKVVTKAYANTITDNVYRYASRGEYYQCAAEAFRQELTLLAGGRIARPMKHITNALVAISLALILNYLIVLRQRAKNARAVKVATPVAAAAGSAAAVVVSSQLIKERTYTHVESSGGHGGRGGFSGGGFSGGGFSGGGGGSVGGGGHSF